MNTDIVTALISLAGVLVTSFVTAIVTIYISRDKKEIKKLNMATLIEKKDDYLKAPTQYIGKLVDFFEGVTSKTPAKVEVAVNDDGRIILFYNLPLKVHLKRIEFFIPERRITFVSDNDQIRSLGMPLSESVTKHFHNIDKILLVKLDERSGEASETGEITFKQYE
jgi:hypothetical protein